MRWIRGKRVNFLRDYLQNEDLGTKETSVKEIDSSPLTAWNIFTI